MSMHDEERNSAGVPVPAAQPALRALPGRGQTEVGSGWAVLGEFKECHQ